MNSKQITVIVVAALVAIGVWYFYGPSVSTNDDDSVNLDEIINEIAIEMQKYESGDADSIRVDVATELTWPGLIFVWVGIVAAAALVLFLRE